MKKITVVLLCVMLAALAVVGCSKPADKTVSFGATVLETGEALLVKPDAGTDEAMNDQIRVTGSDTKITDADGKEITLQDIKVGDKIEITYLGLMGSSYPPTIGATAIKVVA